jgi:outer membrane immunogenic protein
VNGRNFAGYQILVRKYNWLARSRINITIDNHFAILPGISPPLVVRTWGCFYPLLSFLVTFVAWLTLADVARLWGMSMRRFRCAALAAVAVVGFASVASAADMPVKAPPPAPVVAAPNWTGFYAGINAGYGWGKSPTDENGLDPTVVIPAQINGTLPTSLSPNMSGFVGGGQIGYNWQLSKYVVGLETDFDYSAMRGTDTFAVGPIGGFNGMTSTQTNKLDWLGTTRARFGALLNPSTLIFATGGVAYGRTNISSNFVKTTGATVCPLGNTLCAVGSTSDTRVGWTLGAGVESMIAPNWTVKAEYLYFDLGSVTEPIISTANFGTGGTVTMQANAKIQGNVVRVGVNYKFN